MYSILIYNIMYTTVSVALALCTYELVSKNARVMKLQT